MNLTEAELKELYQRRSARSTLGRAECLSEELLRRAAARELTRDEREGVIHHLRTCSDCAQQYRIIHSSRQWASQVAPILVDNSAAAKAAPTRSGRDIPLAAVWSKIVATPKRQAVTFAIVVVIALGGSLIVWQAARPLRQSAPIERGGHGLAMKVEPPDRAQLSEAPQQLSWSEVKGAESYQVELYDFELTPIWESPPVNTTSVEIPDPIRAGLQKGRPVYWRVIISSGIERRQSELFQFVLVSK
jgi:hypothetical protein